MAAGPEAGQNRRENIRTHVDVLSGANCPFLRDVRIGAGRGAVKSVETRMGSKVSAGSFVFACGPWLPKVFPELLGRRIFPTRQEVFFFVVPAGDRRWSMPAMPAWIDVGDLYSFPDIVNRGFKIANDTHGSPFDPDTGERVVTKGQDTEMRTRMATLFPGLKDAPLVETRVCQYE